MDPEARALRKVTKRALVRVDLLKKLPFSVNPFFSAQKSAQTSAYMRSFSQKNAHMRSFTPKRAQ